MFMRRMLLMMAAIFLCLPAATVAGEKFDGTWLTTLTCPAKGNTEGYTWKFSSVVVGNHLKGERGTAGEPGYLVVEGTIQEDGKAKLSANGVVASRTYARGVFAHKGEEYSYDIKAEFHPTEGSGVRNEGLGIVGRPCTFTFEKKEGGS